MKTAVIYARYSSERQTEQSIEGQLRVCQEYAKRNDIVLVDTYIDRAMTGTNDNRASFQRMLKDSNKRAWDIVLVYKLDRFSRDKYETAIHRRTLRNNGIRLISAMENIPDSPEGIILESLLEGMAEYYSAELSQKVRRGMNENRQKGNFTGGYVILGYKIVDKKVVIDEDKAEIVRLIYNRYAAGMIVKDIQAELTEKGIYHRGKPFAINTLHNILKNEKYSGVFHHNGETFTNCYPAIVPPDVFEVVQRKNASNKYGKHSPDIVYLLRDKIVCGYCGSSINAESGTSKSGKVKRYYKCFGRKRGNQCKKQSIRKQALEDLVVNTTMQVLNNPQTISVIADKLVASYQKRYLNQTVLKLLTKEKAETEKAISNLLSAMEKGIVTASTKQRIETLEKKRDTILGKIALEEVKISISLSRDEIIEFISEKLLEEPKVMIDLLVKRIVLYDDKIEITYNYINRKDPDDTERQGLLFYKGKAALPVIIQNKPEPVMCPVAVEIRF